MTDSLHSKTITVLYVEDEESDAYFMQQAFERELAGHVLKTVGDGRQAIDYLVGNDRFANRAEHPLPSLILLDLNLPRLSGFAVLAWIRQRPEHKNLPVVIFSSSNLPEDRKKAEELGANDYWQKPASGFQFREVVRQIRQRWLTTHDEAGDESTQLIT